MVKFKRWFMFVYVYMHTFIRKHNGHKFDMEIATMQFSLPAMKGF